jgi:glycosyltransferase involved in cell wall biosynthesis
MGKPVIATRRPGLSEYLIDGETGILVEPGDDRGMAEAIDMLWNDPQRVVRMGRNAREWIASRHSLDQWLDRVVTLVEQMVHPEQSEPGNRSAKTVPSLHEQLTK